MRYMSRGAVLWTGVAVAVRLPPARRRRPSQLMTSTFRPAIADAALFGDILFCFLPELATVAMASESEACGPFCATRGCLSTGVVVALSWAAWIGLLVNECVPHDNRCFD
jgi:hypothetical protein